MAMTTPSTPSRTRYLTWDVPEWDIIPNDVLIAWFQAVLNEINVPYDYVQYHFLTESGEEWADIHKDPLYTKASDLFDMDGRPRGDLIHKARRLRLIRLQRSMTGAGTVPNEQSEAKYLELWPTRKAQKAFEVEEISKIREYRVVFHEGPLPQDGPQGASSGA